MILSGFREFQPDPGDTTLNHYLLEHSWRWVSDANYHCSFWSPAFFYPTPLVLSFSENLIGMAPIYWLFRGVGIGIIAAYGLWIITLTALNYIAMTTVLRWWRVHPLLAVAGGVIFAVGLPRMAQLNHQHLLTHAMAPFALWHFYKFMREPTLRTFGYLLALTAWQTLASVQLGWFLVFGLAILAICRWLFDWPILVKSWRFLKQSWPGVLVLSAIWVIGMVYFFEPYYQGNRGHRRHYSECITYMPTLSWWLAGPPGSLYGTAWFVNDPEDVERRDFLGVIPWLLIVMAFRTFCRRGASARANRALLVAMTVLMLVALNYYQNISPWWLIYHAVPGANAIRAVGRIFLMVQLFGIVAGIVALDRWGRVRLDGRWRRLVYSIVLIAAWGESQIWPLDRFSSPKFYGPPYQLAHQAERGDWFWYCSNYESRFYINDLQAMWAGLLANRPVINGYSGRWPVDYPEWDDPEGPVAAQRFLGPTARGRLIISHGPDDQSVEVWRIEPGQAPTRE